MGVLLDLAVSAEIIQKSGTWFSYNKERMGQGRENTIRFLTENPEMAEEIDTRLRQIHHLIPETETETETPAESAEA